MTSQAIYRGFQRFFQDAFVNGKASFEDLGDSIKQTFGHLLSELATQALIKPIIVPVVAGIQGLLGSGQFGNSGAGAFGSLFGFSDFSVLDNIIGYGGGTARTMGGFGGDSISDALISGFTKGAPAGGGLFSNIGNLFGGGGSILGGSGSLVSHRPWRSFAGPSGCLHWIVDWVKQSGRHLQLHEWRTWKYPLQGRWRKQWSDGHSGVRHHQCRSAGT
jgi:hypothetical protein